MQKSLLSLICALCALSFIPSSVMATVLLNEHFNQNTETLATNADALPYSGEIAASGWTNIMGNSGLVYVNSSNDLTYSGYKSATDGTKSAEYKSLWGRRVATPLSASVSSGSIYMAGIVKITSVKSNTKDFIWALGVGTSSLNSAGTKQYARPILWQSGSGFKFGIAKLGETLSTTYIDLTDEYEYGTYLLVVEYTFVDGTNNDEIKLYVNPTKGAKPETPTITPKSASSQADASTDIGFGSVLLYSSASTNAACLIDELKVTTSWDNLWEAGEDPEPEPVIGVPEPAASSITLNSATISWDAVEDADSYVFQWKVNGGSYSDDIEIDKDVRSYSMTGLESETKYYVRVKTIIGEDASEWAEINFNTSSEPEMLVYKGVSFEKYSTQNAMPTSGTVFLAKPIVEYASGVTLTGDLTLNLHGKQLFMFGGHIVVPDGVTFTIYDDAGTGEITGGYAGIFLERGIISVKEGGTLIIGEGAVINLDDESEQVAIHNLGTLKLSGAPVISGNKTDIYLGSVITIESGKPLTNETPYKVYKATGSSFTSGWANMSGESPKDYFYSTNVSNRGICLNASGEAQIVPALNLSESSNNTSIASNENQLVNVNLTRSLVSSQYNTFCLPFALDDDQLQEFFGTGYDLEEFVSSSLDGDVLNLVFNNVTSLEAGKPYLLKPSIDVVNPSFEGVTIAATEPADQTGDANISFHATFAPTELEGGNKNLLFLGAENELFYPASTANIKAFRAYFELKGTAKLSAPKARIVKKQDSATGIENQMVNGKCGNHKFLKDGQLYILREGKMYNVLGMEK